MVTPGHKFCELVRSARKWHHSTVGGKQAAGLLPRFPAGKSPTVQRKRHHLIDRAAIADVHVSMQNGVDTAAWLRRNIHLVRHTRTLARARL
jgi:hypothetical protein